MTTGMTINELGTLKAQLGVQIEATLPGSAEEAALLQQIAEVRAEMTRQNCPLFLSSPKVAAELTDDELLLEGAQRAILATPDDFDPTPAEWIAHSGGRKAYGYIASNRINVELKRRGLKDRKVRPW